RRLRGALAVRTRLETERITACRQTIAALRRRMLNLVHGGLERRHAALAAREKLLDSLGYRQVLARGFALVRDAEDRPLWRASEVAPGARLDIEFADGHRAAVAEPSREAKSAEPKKKSAQGLLF
ncbi:MAG: exodeoxyribonuclease VII large subunit, partial [Methylovirgula sp.]